MSSSNEEQAILARANAHHAAILDDMIKWLEENPYEVYGDYRDELPVETANSLLTGSLDPFYEFLDSVEENGLYNADWSSLAQEFYDKFSDQYDFNLDEDDAENDPLIWPDEVSELFNENKRTDISDVINTCLNNTTVHVVAIPLDDNGDPFEFPHWELDDEENERRNKILNETFGITNPSAAELTYSSEILKLCGTIDLKKVYEYGKPSKVTISPKDADNLLCHQTFSGSGNMGTILPTKTVTLNAIFVADAAVRYGVDEVYGFTGYFWSHDINAVWPDPEDEHNQPDSMKQAA